MDALLDFFRGPVFRFALAIMILGLIRVLFLDLFNLVVAYRRAGDKTMPWGYIRRRTFRWLFPFRQVFVNRPFYSIFSMLFHVGLLAVPFFLFAHVNLWREAVGFGWPTLPKEVADWLTLGTIVCAVALVIGRIAYKASRFISRKQDFLWPVLLLVPFISGYACANLGLSATVYQVSMLIHIIAGELIFVLLPFTKIAHCILLPLSQIVSGVAWRFPAETDELVATTLNKKGAPV